MPYVTKTCSSCGHAEEVYHNAQFCKKCGGRLPQSYDSAESEPVAETTAAAVPELAAAGTSLATCVADVGDDLSLVARNADEMKAATSAMAVWFRAKEQIARRDVAELNEAAFIATEKGWKSSALDRQARIADKRAAFYEKCALASEAGYCIVPNMPASLFAVRTNRGHPRGTAQWPTGLAQRSESPPAGEGEYRDPDPLFSRHEGPGDKPGETHRFVQAEYWPEEIEFPIAISRPQIMSATAEAMALKVFDELAICVGGSSPMNEAPPRGRRRNHDPLVLGIVRNSSTSRSSWNDPRVTFLIGWYLDTRTL